MRNNYADQQRTLEKEYKSQGAGGSASGLTPVASGAPQPTRFEYAKGTSGKVYKVPVAFAPATDPGSWIQSSMKTDGINMPIWRKKGDAEGLGQGMAPAPSMLPIDGNPQVDHSKVPVAPPKKIFPTAWEDPAAQPVTNAKPFNWMDLIASGFGTAADVHAMTPGQINPKMLAAQEYRETE
jgi:hypothetical protein